MDMNTHNFNHSDLINSAVLKHGVRGQSYEFLQKIIQHKNNSERGNNYMPKSECKDSLFIYESNLISSKIKNLNHYYIYMTQ